MNVYWYYVLASLYVLLNVCALAANLFTLPGNWFIVALTLLFALLVKHPTGTGIHGWCIAAVAVLAILGEVIELAAGAAGAARSGGSRRGMILAVGGAMLGSIVGTFVGVFIPIP